MKAILLVAAAAALSACASTGAGPQTSWGKPNVTKLDYGTDVGMCTGLAASVSAGNGANQAGGINGRNASGPQGGQGDAAKASGAGGSGPSGAAFPTGGGGAYRDSAPDDVVNRAAVHQRSQELAAKKLSQDTYRSCLAEKGYQEFALTATQRAELAKFQPGSKEYYEYLYKLGADPVVLKTQAK
jgi:hypothetical protein